MVKSYNQAVDAGHQSDVDVVQWHPNSHYVATGSSDRSIRLWDIRDASTARVFVGHRSPVSQPAALSLMQITCSNVVCNVCLGPSVTSETRHHMTNMVLALHRMLHFADKLVAWDLFPACMAKPCTLVQQYATCGRLALPDQYW